MAKQTINIGTTANDGTGDPIRAAFGKVNDNFTEIYTANTGVNTGDQNLSAYATTAAVAAGYQPLDSDLTAISALTTTAYGRALLSTADAATLRSAIGVGTTDAPTFLAQTLTGQSLTGTQATSLVDLATTWNTTGAPTGIKLSVTNTNSNPASLLMDLQVGGVSQFKVDKFGAMILGPSITTDWVGSGMRIGNRYDSITLQNGSALLNMSTSGQVNVGGTLASYALAGNTILATDGTGILAQRNGTSTQQFRVYNTISGVSGVDYERGFMRYATGLLEIGYEFGGLGGSRSVQITTPGDVYLNGTGTGSAVGFKTNGVLRAYFDNGGKLLFNLDNTYDIGASGANRPRNIYAAGVFNFGLINGALPGGTNYGGHLGTSQYFAIKATSTVATAIYIQNGSSGDKTGWVRVLGSGSVDHGALEVGALDSSPVIFTTALTERMRLSAAGNLGIGTTTPASKLTVTSGDIEVATIASGLILKSPDGIRYRVTVPNGGTVLTITAV